ncbi:zeta toxin family protein [Siphonobacter sp. SORGH_AS_1065]|uniref:zeta toxin family protein n=1 Tax=Siphonobacter sp. SORGH_AS_1065 TaxID=3041795 RepID=UPI0027D8F7BE|nr:zeta toxin family protein [Siphonobacter sp. SORGH_AS_1065]
MSEQYAMIFLPGVEKDLLNPKVTFLAGQSGSGKTLLANNIYQEQKGNTVVINSDSIRISHPKYSEALHADPKRASVLVQPDTAKISRLIMEAAASNGYNVIIDGTLAGDHIAIGTTMALFKSKGYITEIAALGVNERVSRLGIYARFEQGMINTPGQARFVDIHAHNKQYGQILENLKQLASDSSLVDNIRIFSREIVDRRLKQVYEGQDVLNSITALEKVRNQPFTPQEQSYLVNISNVITDRMLNRGASQADIDDFSRQAVFTIASRNRV